MSIAVIVPCAMDALADRVTPLTSGETSIEIIFTVSYRRTKLNVLTHVGTLVV